MSDRKGDKMSGIDIISYKLGQKSVGGGAGGEGGGNSSELRYVTFMSHDGTVELGKKAVAVGDDCADPIARGIFDTPTKESTAQYNYSFVGWATTPNGAWDDTALDAVSEDRTLYAAYAAALRYYTVSFYDGDTLLTTKQVAYGGSSTYTPPAKDGYYFDAWEPEPTNVTGDMSCYAQYKKEITFATATWAEIAAIAESGEAANYFKIGDEKPFTYEDYGWNTVNSTAKIIAFNRDTLEDGTTVGITLLSTVAGRVPAMNTSKVTYDGSSGYYAGGFANSYACEWLNSTALNSFPEELKAVIKASRRGDVFGTFTKKLWYLAQVEMGTDDDNYTYEGKRYEGLTPTMVKGTNGATIKFFCRSANKSDYNNYHMQYDSGNTIGTGSGSVKANTAGNAPFSFCI